MDTKQPSLDSANLLPMLALHSARRDRALGLPRPGARTMSLVDYRRKQEREFTRTVTSAIFLKALIDECQVKIHQLIKEAETPEKRRKILPEAQRLNEVARQAATELEKLSNAGS